MKKNRGYSLVELILTMAIFSIIMLAIIALMSSSITTYKDGIFEAQMQEDAQIVANQVADILVDATDINGDPAAMMSSGTYSFIGPDPYGNQKPYSIVYNGSELKYVCDGFTQPLSKMVSNSYDEEGNLTDIGFQITGLEKKGTTDTNTYDNSATVKVTVNGKDGRTYSATKKVYFRNNIEDKGSFDLALHPSTGGGGGGGTDSREDGAVLRFGGLDISKEYGIVYDAKLVGCDDGCFYLKESNDNIIKTTLDSKTPKHYIVMPNATKYETLTGFGLSLKSDATHEYSVEGLDWNGKTVSVKLHLDAVGFDAGGGYFDMYVNDSVGDDSNSGYPIVVQASGIDLNAVPSSIAMSFDAEMTNNGTVYGKTANNSVNTYLTNKSNSSLNFTGVNQFSQAGLPNKLNTVGTNKNDGTDYVIGVFKDAYSNGLIISPAKGLYAKEWHKNFAALTGKKELNITYRFKQTTPGGTEKTVPINLKWRLSGTTF